MAQERPGHQGSLAMTRSWERGREPVSCGAPKGANPARISTSHFWPPVPGGPQKLLHLDSSAHPVVPKATALPLCFQSLTVSAVQKLVIRPLTCGQKVHGSLVLGHKAHVTPLLHLTWATLLVLILNFFREWGEG